MSDETLTQASLKKQLHYDPLTGIFTWLYGKQGRRADLQAGKIRRDKYVSICINYKDYLAHRLAWLYMTGEWPKLDIDHIDRNPSNNAWVNLREVSRSANLLNMSAHGNKEQNAKGVFWDAFRKKWRVQIAGIFYGRYASEAVAKSVAASIYNKETTHGK